MQSRRPSPRTGAALLLLVALLVWLAGCGEQPRPTARLVYIDWTESIGMTNVARVVLEERLGYEVEMIRGEDMDAIFSMLARGEADAFLNAWLPITHREFVDRYGPDLIDLGYNFQGCRIGLAVPVYVPIESIPELAEEEGRVGRRIWGIDDDAGVMRKTREAIEVYDLDLELLTTSSSEMTEALDAATDAGDWIVITAWKPHWKFKKWRLKFLADPEGVYEPRESIHTVARRALPEEKPRLAAFLRRFRLEGRQLESLMHEILPTRDEPERAVRTWMIGESALIESWVEDPPDPALE